MEIENGTYVTREVSKIGNYCDSALFIDEDCTPANSGGELQAALGQWDSSDLLHTVLLRLRQWLTVMKFASYFL